jgi:signal transduction histidine kinase/CheY-like chemotaxis protein/HPt (histidine-containing phosphotransfer) domain-containing protein
MSIKETKNNSSNSISNALQELILKITSDCINLPSSQFMPKMNDAFRLIGGYLDIDYIHLYEYINQDGILDCTFEWCNHQIKPQIEVFRNETFCQTLIAEHQNKKPIIIKELSLLENNHKLANLLNNLGIASFYSIPLIIDKQLLGYLTFSDMKNQREWKGNEQKLLKMLSDILANLMYRKHLVTEIKEMNKKALSATEAKNQFLANMSHEIRTPLSGIYNAFYLLETTSLTAEQKEYLEIGQSSVEALSAIVDDVLSLTKIESGEIEIYEDPFNMEEELIRIMRMQKGFADEKAIQLSFDFDYQINFDCIGDYRKLNQVVAHLINNAIKYTEHGNVTLKVDLIESVKNKVIIKLDIIDTGIGVDQNQIKRLFDAFYQVDSSESRKQQGVGLGLPISNQLIQRLDGKLDIQSKPNQGSIFSITLPLTKGKKHVYPATTSKHALYTTDQLSGSTINQMLESMGIKTLTFDTIKDEKCDLIIIEKPVKSYDVIKDLINKHGTENTLSISFDVPQNKRIKKIDCFFDPPISRVAMHQKLKIQLNKEAKEEETIEYNTILNGYALIVDDNRLNRIALESILNKQGIRTKTAESGPKAIEIMKNEDFDIVLMDIQMPEMDGIETIRRIRNLGKKYQDIPMVAITANAFFKDYDLMKTTRINDVIFKPINMNHLNLILRKYIRTGTSIHIPDELGVFDEKDFKQRFEGSDDIAAEVIETFIETYTSDLQNIKTAILKRLSEEIISTCHYFKGSCAYLSGKRSVWMLDYMMDAAKNHKLEFMNLCFDMLESEVNEMIKVIKKL